MWTASVSARPRRRPENTDGGSEAMDQRHAQGVEERRPPHDHIQPDHLYMGAFAVLGVFGGVVC